MLHGARVGTGWASVPATDYFVQVAVVPVPPLLSATQDSVISAAHYANAASIFQHPAVRGMRVNGVMDDGVALVGGMQAGARFADGSIFLAQRSTDSYVSVPDVGNLVTAVIECAAMERPTAHQVLVDVRILGATERRLSENRAGTGVLGRPLPRGELATVLLTGTDTSAALAAGALVERRVWRAVGDQRGLQP
jgi:hypothetical protein